MRRELAVLCLTIDDGKVLMVKRLKEPCLGCLVPPGGHVEDGELPHEACVRETLEEAGWLVEVLETPSLNLPQELTKHVRRVKNPLLIQEEFIDVNHYHVDFIYLCRPIARVKELEGVAWIDINDVVEGGVKTFEELPTTLKALRGYIGGVRPSL